MMELFRALAALAEPPGPATERLSVLLELGEQPTPAAYTDLFQFQLYPFASVYLSVDGMIGGEARDRMAGFWRALGEEPPSEPDHLATMLALHAELAAQEDGTPAVQHRDAWRRARGAHLHEHLLPWLPFYLEKLSEIAPPSYAVWGQTVEQALRAEVEGHPASEEDPLHFRAAGHSEPQSLTDEELIAHLLAPFRSGLIVTRSDLRRSAAVTRLGLRQGERRFAFRSLLEQDRASTLAFWKREAAYWTERHRARAGFGPHEARFWADRAANTVALIGGLRPREEVA